MTDFAPLTKPLEQELIEKAPSASYWQEAWSGLKKNKGFLFGLWTLATLLVMALIGPFLSPYPYYEIHLPLKNSPPSFHFWFGTDELGRDIFCRIWWGARISLSVGISAAIIDMAIGVLVGATAGFLGKKYDTILMRMADILHSIPYLLVVILLAVMIGSGITSILIALTITGWIPMARIVRGHIMQLKHLEYAEAAYALGASPRRILWSHLLPNASGPIITTMTFTIPAAIFAESFLSFLGLGIQAPIASWGTMASEGLAALNYYPWRLFFPSIFISLTMFAFNLIGDALRDAFDPRLHI